jgi:hypothetical protein
MKDALRDVMPSARIPTFTWHGGDLFNAELWMLNDSPKEVCDCVEVFLEVAGKRHHVLSWDAGVLPAMENKRGHMIQWVLPEVTEQTDIVLTLKSSHGDSSYRLLLQPKVVHTVDHHALNA